ncbi:MAG: glycosyltransferase family 4 protein [Phycisphaerales bacterium]|nr:glycosyltransferase family 4 protein [Phycisphaerales bacterium]
MQPQSTHAPKAVRVVIQQPALPKYRVPVYAELARRPGIDVTVRYDDSAREIASVAPNGFNAEVAPIHSLRIGGRTLRWHPAQVRSATRADADVLILMWDLHYASLPMALLRARMAGVKTVLWGHGYSKTDAAWRAWPRRQVTRAANALLFYNHTIAKRYIEMGVDPQKIFVAPNALDQSPIQSAREHWLGRADQLREFQRRHQLDRGPVILFVSRFDPANRTDLLLHAASRLRHSHPTLRVVLVGKGSDETNLRQLTESLGLGDQVLFPGAIYDELELAPWFLSSTLFCYPVNIGLSLLHAFGYGLPVITSAKLDSHGPEIEALVHGENGLLYRHLDVDALTEAVQSILDDEAFGARLSRAAHQTATGKYSLHAMVDGMEAAIRYCASLQR